MLSELQALVFSMQQNVFFVLILLGAMFAINFVNWLMGSWMHILGIYPRSWHGLIGIIFSPVLHGDFNHLFFNSVPLFVFANLILLYGHAVFYCVTGLVVIISGLIVWVVGRKAFHIGASGVVMGYWSYLLINAFVEKTAMALILGAVSLYYFGGLILELFSSDAKVSLEGHIAGFISGIGAYYLCQSGSPILAYIISLIPA